LALVHIQILANIFHDKSAYYIKLSTVQKPYAVSICKVMIQHTV